MRLDCPRASGKPLDEFSLQTCSGATDIRTKAPEAAFGMFARLAACVLYVGSSGFPGADLKRLVGFKELMSVTRV
jgi:hypothetical protein